jgi:hypothetical protein
VTPVEPDGPVNQGRALSGAAEKSGGKERNGTHRGDRVSSLAAGAETRVVRKLLALLGIPRESGMGAQ